MFVDAYKTIDLSWYIKQWNLHILNDLFTSIISIYQKKESLRYRGTVTS